MGWRLVSAAFLALSAIATATVIPCLNGCLCETNTAEPIMRCDSLKLTHFPLPIAFPYDRYNFLALTCNNIVTVPSYNFIIQAFPNLHGIDLQGNPNLNCSSLSTLQGKVAMLSDCNNKQPLFCETPKPTSSNTKGTGVQKTTDVTKPVDYQQECDLRCKNIVRLAEMWKEIQTLAKKVNVNSWLEWMGRTMEKVNKATSSDFFLGNK